MFFIINGSGVNRKLSYISFVLIVRKEIFLFVVKRYLFVREKKFNIVKLFECDNLVYF